MKEEGNMNFSGTIEVIPKRNPRQLYEHQIEAIDALTQLNQAPAFRTLLVIPTGGGKTLVGSWWLLRHALNKGKKVLWIAHRQLLLEQALASFQSNAYATCMPDRWRFNYRLISGQHDSLNQINPKDDLLIISKDTLTKRTRALKRWLTQEKEVFIVIDEAHHSPAQTYQTIINYVDSQVENLKLIGLTATPFRTSENERGLLGDIFKDDIVYKVDLTDLIKRGILARPHFEECSTDLSFKSSPEELKKIQKFDIISEEIAKQMSQHKLRNAMIVKHYVRHQSRYKQTIVFAINRLHALVLKTLFEREKIACGVVISRDLQEQAHQNQDVIEQYQKGEIKVLINVNILTEGTDLPQTQTVFLTRPTVSSILMTQMMGRALRGERAGGTKEAYVVSFIDEWQDQIAWINAESVFVSGPSDLEIREKSESEKICEMISLKQLEWFAKMLDESIDESLLENIPFIKRIPLGMYNLTLNDQSHQILIYDSTKKRYEHLINQLSSFFEYHQVRGSKLSQQQIKLLSDICARRCFGGNIFPTYDRRDLEALLKYYAKHRSSPQFIPFDQLDRERLDLEQIAKFIIEQDMTRQQQREYVTQLWNDPNELFSIYFNKKLFFMRHINQELRQLVKNRGEKHE